MTTNLAVLLFWKIRNMNTFHWIGHTASCNDDFQDGGCLEGFTCKAQSFIDICNMVDKINATKHGTVNSVLKNAQATEEKTKCL